MFDLLDASAHLVWFLWSAYRDKPCEYVGSMFGGGSGTGIAIRCCRIEYGRDHSDELMQYAQ